MGVAFSFVVFVLVVVCLLVCLLVWLAPATESWLGGFYCTLSSGMVCFLVGDGLQMSSCSGLVSSPVHLLLYSFSFLTSFFR